MNILRLLNGRDGARLAPSPSSDALAINDAPDPITAEAERVAACRASLAVAESAVEAPKLANDDATKAHDEAAGEADARPG